MLLLKKKKGKRRKKKDTHTKDPCPSHTEQQSQEVNVISDREPSWIKWSLQAILTTHPAGQYPELPRWAVLKVTHLRNDNSGSQPHLHSCVLSHLLPVSLWAGHTIINPYLEHGRPSAGLSRLQPIPWPMHQTHSQEVAMTNARVACPSQL